MSRTRPEAKKREGQAKKLLKIYNALKEIEKQKEEELERSWSIGAKDTSKTDAVEDKKRAKKEAREKREALEKEEYEKIESERGKRGNLTSKVQRREKMEAFGNTYAQPRYKG